MISRVLPASRGAGLLTAARGPLAPAVSSLFLRSFATKVTFVKKIYSDGSTCQKCDFVWKQMVKDGLSEKIDRTVYADERDTSSEGIVLARKHKVSKAPFFVVIDDA